jgi:hypothetical protein
MTKERENAVRIDARRRVAAALATVGPTERVAVLTALIAEANAARRRETVPEALRASAS